MSLEPTTLAELTARIASLEKSRRMNRRLVATLVALSLLGPIFAASLMNGNFGVGIDPPIAKLHVQNTGVAASFQVNDSASDGTPFVVDAAGNVGIKTASPSASLSVNGNIAASSTISATGGNSSQWNTAFGWGNHASQPYTTGPVASRIVYGIITSAGVVQEGTGFSVNRTGVGFYEITFSSSFVGFTSLTANSISGHSCDTQSWVQPNVVLVACRELSTTLVWRDSYFSFIAVGPR